MPPAAVWLMPPTNGSFSIRMTEAPSCWAARAAAIPVRPEPATTTSASMVNSSVLGVSPARTLNAFTASWPPACSMQSRTAFRIAWLVMVAPATPSTFTLWCSTIRPGTVSMAASEML